MASKKSPKIDKKYCCESCYYSTCKLTDYNKHISTEKHKKYQNASKLLVNASEKSTEIQNTFICECGKIYKHDSSFYRHKKVCNNENTTNVINKVTDKDELILMLIKQNFEITKENSEFKNFMIEQQNMMMKVIENGTTNHSHNTTNSHNKSFNLQFFLNETCKDAMNIMDFVDSIKLQLSDLEKVGEIGYVDGISNIIVKNLNALEVEKRPVHCTDKKREVLYIKDENKWEKEDNEKNRLRKAIKRVASKNQRLLPKFKEAHPDCIKAASQFSDQYNKMIIESMGGSGDNDLEKEDKIIRNISKNVVIDKNI